MPTLLLGVCGGIAAYKTVDLTSQLRKRGWEVHVLMTDAATRFITPLTFQSISRHPVRISQWEASSSGGIEHIEAAREADVFLICPATADVLAKLAGGHADDLLTTTALASTAPLLIAPAMNPHMWEHPATKANVQTLLARGARMVMPQSGEMACGDVGVGRLASIDSLLASIENALKRPLAGLKVLVTAGGTREPVDGVRYVGNRSSGKMGYAIAKSAQQQGATVTLVTSARLAVPPGINAVAVETALQMRQAVLDIYDTQDIVVMAAAVADYRPAETQETKRKKSNVPWTLSLVPNPDILAELGASKRHQFLVGFAAETGDPLSAAFDKLKRKNADLMVANDVSQPDQGFETDTNRVSIIGEEGLVAEWPLLAKQEIADRLWELLIERRGMAHRNV
jgi:phosphopantothenoylcysteine decarboxylase/phosphopantothenate--cysteine ligase